MVDVAGILGRTSVEGQTAIQTETKENARLQNRVRVCVHENVVGNDVTVAKMEHHHITIPIVARDCLSFPGN